MFPACGLSNIYREDITAEQIRIRWTPFDGTVCVDAAIADIKELLSRNGLTTDDISAFCLSQFSLKNIELIQEGLGLSEEKFIYVGDEFGYTATSSPFIAFQRGVEDGRIKRGDYVFFWSVRRRLANSDDALPILITGNRTSYLLKIMQKALLSFRSKALHAVANGYFCVSESMSTNGVAPPVTDGSTPFHFSSAFS